MSLVRRLLFGALLLMGNGLFAAGSLGLHVPRAQVIRPEALRCLPVVPEPSAAVIGRDLAFALAVPWPTTAAEMGENGAYDGKGFFSLSGRVVPVRSRATSYFHLSTLFQGREYDFDLALYNYRARYYDPRMGRFLQTDPMGYHDSMNLYQGMNMNPLNYVDPLGKYFYVPEDDPNKERILNALAEGALTEEGAPKFYSLLNDNRKITIQSGELLTDLKHEHLVKKSDKVNFSQVYGMVDVKGALENTWNNDKKARDVNVTISFNNLDNYFLVKRRFGYFFNNQGNLDDEGITTIYHELEHVNDLFTLDSSIPTWVKAYQKVYEGEFETDASGNITSRKYSHLSRAQRFGEKVFNASNDQEKRIEKLKKDARKISQVERQKQIDAIKTLIN